MKRKVFALLLTLSLALSFMPMIALADTEEEIVPVNEAVEEEKADTEEVVQDNVEEENTETTVDETATEKESEEDASQQIVDGQTLEEFAGDAKQAKCSHSSTYTVEEWGGDISYTEIPGDNKYHKVTGTIYIVTYCEDCDAEISRKTTKVKGKEYEHYYEGKVCTECGHKNSCKHGDTFTYEEWDPEDVTYKKTADNKYHKVTGTIDIVTECDLCGAEVSRVSTKIKEKEYEHEYNNKHVCMECGHKNSCIHMHTDYDYFWDKDVDNVKFTNVNNTYHRVTGTAYLDTWCEDCGETYKQKKIRIDDKFCHDYNSKHVCTDCGHKNTCSHPSKEAEYYYDDEMCKIADTGDGSRHKVTGDITKLTNCKVCKEKLKEEKLGKKTVTEDHYYNRDDVCIYCGYRIPDIRTYGSDRYDTAIEAAEKFKGSAGKFENIIVAYGRNFPDALSGGYLAKVKNAPILLVEPSVEDRIADYISNNILLGGKVYILGETGAVSSSFENKVKAKGISTERLGGNDRYETNIKILKEAGVKAEEILVCTGTGFADSLSAAAVGKPILLVGKTLTADQTTYIKSLSTKKFYLIGGKGVVESVVKKDLENLGFKTERIEGETRFETSAKVANKFFEKATTVILAYAYGFPDGLSGGPLAMMKGAPIILTDSDNTTAAEAYVKAAKASRNVTLGGPLLISDEAVKAIMGRK